MAVVSVAVEGVRRRNGRSQGGIGGHALRCSMNGRCLRSGVLGVFASRRLIGVRRRIGRQPLQSCWALGLLATIFYEVMGRALCTGQSRPRDAFLLQFVGLSTLSIRGRRLFEDVQEAVRRARRSAVRLLGVGCNLSSCQEWRGVLLRGLEIASNG